MYHNNKKGASMFVRKLKGCAELLDLVVIMRQMIAVIVLSLTNQGVNTRELFTCVRFSMPVKYINTSTKYEIHKHSTYISAKSLEYCTSTKLIFLKNLTTYQTVNFFNQVVFI